MSLGLWLCKSREPSNAKSNHELPRANLLGDTGSTPLPSGEAAKLHKLRTKV